MVNIIFVIQKNYLIKVTLCFGIWVLTDALQELWWRFQIRKIHITIFLIVTYTADPEGKVYLHIFFWSLFSI